MLFSEARGHKVVSTRTADTVGRVKDFVVDPATRRVVALEVRKSAEGDTLLWADLGAFGADAVTVAEASSIGAAGDDIAALTGKDHRLVGKRVLSSVGDELGTVSDVEFDHESGAVTALVLGSASVVGARLVGVGSYAVVVTAE